jgi:hypothetical protein
MRRKKAARPKRGSTIAGNERRDPEDRIVDPADLAAKREKMFDKTIADSFPASDAPSSVPDPDEDSFCSNASATVVSSRDMEKK